MSINKCTMLSNLSCPGNICITFILAVSLTELLVHCPNTPGESEIHVPICSSVLLYSTISMVLTLGEKAEQRSLKLSTVSCTLLPDISDESVIPQGKQHCENCHHPHRTAGPPAKRKLKSYSLGPYNSESNSKLPGIKPQLTFTVLD